MAPRECPRCEILNEATAEQCDCGYVFTAKNDEIVRATQVGSGVSMMKFGGFALTLGVGGFLLVLVTGGPVEGPTDLFGRLFLIMAVGGVFGLLQGLKKWLTWRKAAKRSDPRQHDVTS